MTGLGGELRASVRSLRRRPAFTAGAVLALMLGVGANLGLFTLLNAVVLRELPYRDADRLLWIWSTRTDRDRAFFSLPDFVELRAETKTLDAAIGVAAWGVTLTGGERPARLTGVRMSAAAFDVLGLRPAAGRLLTAEDGDASRPRVVVLGHRLWLERFGARSSVVGETLVLDGVPYTVVGVAPRDFELPALATDVTTPLLPEADPLRDDRGSNFLRLLGRLAPGASVEQARAELAAIIARQRDRYPDTNAKKTAPRPVALRDEIAGGWRSTLPLVYGASALVLLVACANLANLLLSRANDRAGELAIRAALGASRARLAFTRLVEGLLLSVLGAAPAFLVARWIVDLVRRFGPGALPRASSIVIDGRVVGYGATLTLLVAVTFSLMPAILDSARATRGVDLVRAMSGRGSRGREHGRVARRLVIAEIALSLALLVGAGLLVRSLQRLQQVSPGFDAAGLLVAELSLPRAAYTQPGALGRFFAALDERLRAVPGIDAAAAVNVLPLSGINARSDFRVEGRAAATAAEIPAGQSRWVTAGYFRTLGIAVVAGRELDAGDRADGAPVLMVDRALATRFLADVDPLAQRLALDYTGTPLPPAAIVGVAGDIKHTSLEEEPTPTFYGPIDQAPATLLPFLCDRMVLVVRAEGDPLALAEPVRRAIAAIDPDVATGAFRTAEQSLTTALAPRRFNVALLTAFAFAALVLACTGLYAVVADAVAQRRRELAVRAVLGAERLDVVGLVLGDVARLMIVGLAIGGLLASGLARLLASFLFATQPSDLLVWLAVLGALVVAALAAAILPALRASASEPLEALRQTP